MMHKAINQKKNLDDVIETMIKSSKKNNSKFSNCKSSYAEFMKYFESGSDEIPQHILMTIDPTSRSFDGRTPYMMWVVERKTLPPVQLLHDPKLMDVNGNTAATLWIIHRKSDPPACLHHSAIFDDKWYAINSPSLCWKRYIKTEPMKWMGDASVQCAPYGLTVRELSLYNSDPSKPFWNSALHYWLHARDNRRQIPEWMFPPAQNTVPINKWVIA
jgi:hypothetical protein